MHVFFVASVLVVAVGIISAIIQHHFLHKTRVSTAHGETGKKESRIRRGVSHLFGHESGITPFRIVFATVGLAIFLILFPTVSSGAQGSLGWGVVFLETLYMTFQVFSLDADIAGALDTLRSSADLLARVEALYSVVLFVMAPVIAVGFILSFIETFTSHVRCLLHRRSDVNIFSELNERSLALAQSMHTRHPQDVIIFTDVTSSHKRSSAELVSGARRLNSILFTTDILDIPLHRHGKHVRFRFFIMGSSDEESVWHASSLMDDARYRDRRNTDLFLFSDTFEGELALRYRKGTISARRINPARTLIYSWLWQREGDQPAGIDLFRIAREVGQTKVISAAILGLGGHGSEMVKALTWFCQMDEGPHSYRLQLRAYDKDPEVVATFQRDHPGLMDHSSSPDSADVDREDAYFDIAVRGGVDVNSPEFVSQLMGDPEVPPPTFIFISLGDDGLNIETSAALRRDLARQGCYPQILVVSSNSRAILGALNQAEDMFVADNIDQFPRIQTMGDVSDVFSYESIIRSEVETLGLLTHLQWAEWESPDLVKTLPAYVQKFWEDEYFYNASICVPVHWRARHTLGIPGLDLPVDASDQERQQATDFLSRLEHARWNAFMKSEGFIYGTQKDIHVARTHPSIVDFAHVKPQDKKKDDNDPRVVLPNIETKFAELVDNDNGQHPLWTAFLHGYVEFLTRAREIITSDPAET